MGAKEAPRERAGRGALQPLRQPRARREYAGDPEGVLTLTGKKTHVSTGTLTIEAMPTKNLIVRLDNRVDPYNEQRFPKKIEDGAEKTQITTTSGVVVQTKLTGQIQSLRAKAWQPVSGAGSNNIV